MFQLGQLKKEVQGIKQELGAHDRRIHSNQEGIEANERNTRKYNVRIYGYDFSKCRNREQHGNFKVVQPDQLVKEMLEKGLHLDQATIEDRRMVTYH